jgi:hypothetical protein
LWFAREQERGEVFANGLYRYHHMNHYAMFGRGYRGGAVRIMERLIEKYGNGA